MPSDLRTLDVVGIGADGWDGLSPSSQGVLRQADIVLGGPRQLDLLDDSVPGRREPLPNPLLPALVETVDRFAAERLAVLASGDPMFFGIGSTLIRLLGAERIHVHPHPSSVSFAAARLGWPLDDLDVISLVGRPLALLQPAVQPGRRVLVLVGTSDAPARIRALLDARGYRRSALSVLSNLGGPHEWVGPIALEHDPLSIVAIGCLADPGTAPLSRTPGLPDDAFEHDGQITKREIRALALAALAPVPGQLLWDVGAGSGSIGIEWSRVHPASRAIAIEPREDRRQRIERNSIALGAPGLQIVAGSAPDALADLPVPDAIFVGGGVSVPGVLETCIDALAPGGRIVANAVTIETETVLAGWHARRGGTLTRLAIQRAAPIGGFTGWRPAMPVTQWAYQKDGR